MIYAGFLLYCCWFWSGIIICLAYSYKKRNKVAFDHYQKFNWNWFFDIKVDDFQSNQCQCNDYDGDDDDDDDGESFL